MELTYKDNFTETRQNWQKFWDGELGRPAISAVIPKQDAVARPAFGAGFQGNYQEIAENVLQWAETHDFIGEAIPFYCLSIGSMQFSMYMGNDYEAHGNGSGGWPVHCFADKKLSEVDIKFQKDGKWWQEMLKFADVLKSICGGHILLASHTLVSGLDALVALRGNENTMFDMIDDPEGTLVILQKIDDVHAQVLEEMSKIFNYDEFGSINRHGMYSNGRINVPQSDFSCMISPEMFKEFALPFFKKEFSRYDAVEYHLDGPGSIHHLELLASLNQIDVIQWVYGAGNENKDWSELYARIDNYGIGQMRSGTPEQLLTVMKNLKNPKLYWNLWGVSASEARELIDELAT